MRCHDLASDLRMALDPVLWAKSELAFDPDLGKERCYRANLQESC